MTNIIYAGLYTENLHIDGEFVVQDDKISFTDYEETVDISLDFIFLINISYTKLYCKFRDEINIFGNITDYIIFDVENMNDFYGHVLASIRNVLIINTESSIYVKDDKSFTAMFRRNPICLCPVIYYKKDTKYHKDGYYTCLLQAHTNGFILTHKPGFYQTPSQVHEQILYRDIDFISLYDSTLKIGNVKVSIYRNLEPKYEEQVRTKVRNFLLQLIEKGIPVPIIL